MDKCSDVEIKLSKTFLLFAGVESQSQQYLVRSASKDQSVAVNGGAKLLDLSQNNPSTSLQCEVSSENSWLLTLSGSYLHKISLKTLQPAIC